MIDFQIVNMQVAGDESDLGTSVSSMIFAPQDPLTEHGYCHDPQTFPPVVILEYRLVFNHLTGVLGFSVTQGCSRRFGVNPGNIYGRLALSRAFDELQVLGGRRNRP